MRLLSLAALLCLVATVSAQDTSPTGDFLLTVAGDTLRGDIELKDPFLGRLHIVHDGERREIADMREIRIDDETMAVVDGRSLATLVQDGRVRFYSRSTYSPPIMTPGPNGIMTQTGGSSQEIGYVQVGQGPVERATIPALRAALGDNPVSVSHLERYKTLGIVQTGITVVGVSLLAVGGYQMYQAEQRGDDITVSPLAVIGIVGAGAGQLIIPGMRSSARRQAIDSYNQ